MKMIMEEVTLIMEAAKGEGRKVRVSILPHFPLLLKSLVAEEEGAVTVVSESIIVY